MQNLVRQRRNLGGNDAWSKSTVDIMRCTALYTKLSNWLISAGIVNAYHKSFYCKQICSHFKEWFLGTWQTGLDLAHMGNFDYYLSFFDSWTANLFFLCVQSYLLPDSQRIQ